MFNAGKKTAVALLSRMRVMSNATRIDGNLLSQTTDDFDAYNNLPFSITTDEYMTLSVTLGGSRVCPLPVS
jgi:hypothetical protein